MEEKKPKTKRSQLEAQIKYDRDHVTRISLKLNKTTDKDILDKLDSVPGKQTYIKELIRRDINGHKEK